MESTAVRAQECLLAHPALTPSGGIVMVDPSIQGARSTQIPRFSSAPLPPNLQYKHHLQDGCCGDA